MRLAALTPLLAASHLTNLSTSLSPAFLCQACALPAKVTNHLWAEQSASLLVSGSPLPEDAANMITPSHCMRQPGSQPQARPHKQNTGRFSASQTLTLRSGLIVNIYFFSPSGVRTAHNKLGTSSHPIAASAIMAQTYYICCNFEKAARKMNLSEARVNYMMPLNYITVPV